jgi:hypothetical protein
MQPTTYSHDFIDIHDTREDLNRAIARLVVPTSSRSERGFRPVGTGDWCSSTWWSR